MVRINRETTWYPWVCWLIAASVFLVQYGLLVFPSTITQPLEKSLSIDSTEIGVFYSAFLYTYILMQIPAGFLFDRYSAKKLLMFASAMMAAGCISLIYSGSFLTGIISRMLMGFGGSFAFVGAIYLGREWFSVLMFPVVVGLTEAMSGVGTVGFSSIFSIASTHQKWQTTLAEITIFIIIQIILIKIFVTDKHSKGGYKYSKDTLIHHAALVFKNPTIWLTAIYIGFGFAHYMTLTNLWRLSFLKHQFHIPISYAILENSLVVVGYIIGGP